MLFLNNWQYFPKFQNFWLSNSKIIDFWWTMCFYYLHILEKSIFWFLSINMIKIPSYLTIWLPKNFRIRVFVNFDLKKSDSKNLIFLHHLNKVHIHHIFVIFPAKISGFFSWNFSPIINLHFIIKIYHSSHNQINSYHTT